MKIYLYPNYVSLGSAEYQSPSLFALLKDKGVEIEEANWQGNIASLPTDKPAIIRDSSVADCSSEELAEFCAQHGHLCFYDDSLVTQGGGLDNTEALLEAAEAFLEKNKDWRIEPEQLIAFLKSRPRDGSTLGSGRHLARKSERLLEMWDEHVLKPHNEPTVLGDNRYRVVQLSKDYDEARGEDERFGDLEGLKELRQQVEDDLGELTRLDCDLGSGHERARIYCEKLRDGLYGNLVNLRIATDLTSHAYGMGQVFGEVMGVGGGLELSLRTMTSRRSIDFTAQGVSVLYAAMLPVVVKKLVEAGYPDCDEQVEWD